MVRPDILTHSSNGVIVVNTQICSEEYGSLFPSACEIVSHLIITMDIAKLDFALGFLLNHMAVQLNMFGSSATCSLIYWTITG